MYNTKKKENDKNKQTIQLLSEMFFKMSLEEIETTCTKYNWNVDDCIDALLNSNNRKSESSQKSLQGGAVRKLNNEVQNISRNNTRNAINPIKSKIIEHIKSGFRVMVLMRGAPGSGKSYLAQSIVQEYVSNGGQYNWRDFVLSTDDFFYNGNGEYRFRFDRLDEAHLYNQKRAGERAQAGWSPIFIDNTNMQIWNMLPYVQIAVRHGYLVEILEANTPWCFSAGRLAMKNSHKVPRETIERMLDKYEKATVADLYKLVDKTKGSIPIPQIRNFPPIQNESAEHNSTATVKSNELINITESASKRVLPSKMHVPNVERLCLGDEVLASNSDFMQTGESAFSRLTTEAEQDARQQMNHINIEKNYIKCDNISETMQSVSYENQNNEDITLTCHKINCPNEDTNFRTLRQIYPNKHVSILWKVFVKSKGQINVAVDSLIKELEDLSESSDRLLHKSELFTCDCDVISNDVDKNTNFEQFFNPNHKSKKTMFASFEKDVSKQNTSDHSNMINPHRYEQILNFGGEALSKDVQTQTETFDDDENDDELMELVLNRDFIDQLISKFQSEVTLTEKIPQFSTSKIFIPRMLAKEIYMLWMESMYNQIEEKRFEMVKEDEQFARLLTYPKYENQTTAPPKSGELLDMELAWLIYKTDLENNKAEDVDIEGEIDVPDLATHLSRMKLCEMFPKIPRETLLKMYAVSKKQFNKTIEQAHAWMELNKESLLHIQENIYKRAEEENKKSEEKKLHNYEELDDSTENKIEAQKSQLHKFEEMRNLAAHHSQLKAECHQKAREAIQRNNYDVALYYSQIGNLHRQKIDYYNNRAANYIMSVHNLEKNNPDFLDLHYLHTTEAVVCLDIFLDRQIAALRNNAAGYKHVFIITGRGLHSVGGVSTIKNRVKNRLKERNLRWSEVNPGLLKVKVFPGSRFSVSNV